MAITETPPGTEQSQQPEHAPGDREMTMLEHLDELRHRLVVSVISVVVGLLVSIIPAPGVGSITENVVKLLAVRAPGGKLYLGGPGEGFFTFLQVSLIIGVAIAMPVIVYQVLSFVTPALYENERKYLFVAVP